MTRKTTAITVAVLVAFSTIGALAPAAAASDADRTTDLDDDYVEECLSEFTYPAPSNPDTVCGKVAQLYGEITEPESTASEDIEQLLSQASSPEEYVDECLDELIYWPAPSDPDTVCGEVAQLLDGPPE